MSATGDRELPRLLEQGLGDDLNFYFSEYIDQGRFPDTGYQAAFSDFLRVKYKGQRIDLVIAIQSAAVEFINQRRDELFPDTPVVYLALAPLTRRLANSTGVIAQLDLARTLALAVGAAAQRSARLRRQRRGQARQGVRAHDAGAVAAVRISTRDHLPVGADNKGSRGAAGHIARGFDRLLPGGLPGWGGRRPSVQRRTWNESRPLPVRRPIHGSMR